MASNPKVFFEMSNGGQAAGGNMTIGSQDAGRDVAISGQRAGFNMTIGGQRAGRDISIGGQPAGRMPDVGFEAMNAVKVISDVVTVLEKAGYRTCSIAVVMVIMLVLIKAVGF